MKKKELALRSKSWVKRWFVLSRRSLYYYKTEEVSDETPPPALYSSQPVTATNNTAVVRSVGFLSGFTSTSDSDKNIGTVFTGQMPILSPSTEVKSPKEQQKSDVPHVPTRRM